jgi:hypothetical protein
MKNRKVDADLVLRDTNGEILSVRYDQVNAMLLNEFLKEHRKVEQQACEIQEQKAAMARLKSTVAKQEARIAQQQKGMDILMAQLEEQAAQIQKVSAQMEMSRSAPNVALNSR